MSAKKTKKLYYLVVTQNFKDKFGGQHLIGDKHNFATRKDRQEILKYYTQWHGNVMEPHDEIDTTP